ncbi:MAG: hypothetical protein A2046_16760 [Bacteroidetes bacterium GWA2_30_7]|nr:MAG: hypothetical protein A2046_16760 [Bacteroidetes bacterium GWA2_30_7]
MKKIPLHISFIIYVVLVIFLIPYHEPWADEAQAWLMARDSNISQLLFTNLHYEGSPGLWHILLMLPSRFLPYEILNYISVLIVISGVFLLIYYSPFQVWMKILFPFTYFIFYQYSVIARCYCLLIVLLFFIAYKYNNRFKNPFLFVLPISLLANVNLHGFIISLALMFIYFIDLIRFRKKEFLPNLKVIISIFIIYLIVALFVIIQIIPASDISISAEGIVFNFEKFYNFSLKILGEVFAVNSFLSYSVLIVSLVWFLQNRLLLFYLVVNLAILALFSIYYNIWHQGVLILIWLFTLWLTYYCSEKRFYNVKILNNVLKRLMQLSVAVFIISHVYWSFKVYVNDYKYDYSAGKKIATFIKENNLQDKYLYSTQFWSISILPYFDKNIFQTPNFKENTSYWVWKKSNDYSEHPDSIIKKQPDLIIFSRPWMFWSPNEIKGYKFLENFKGNVLWKDSIRENNDFNLFLKF